MARRGRFAFSANSGLSALPEIQKRLDEAQPYPVCELDYQDPWQLLIATLLSARTRDALVNTITPELFSRWPGPIELADASQEDVEEVIRKVRSYRNKAAWIRDGSALLVDRFGGQVPRSLEELIELPGVSRKTANMVLGVAFGIPSGFIVDTHVSRVAQRLELTEESEPEGIEEELCRSIPRDSWVESGLRLILHGRYVCTARNPECRRCALHELCPSSRGEPEGDWSSRALWEQGLSGQAGVS